MTANRTPLAPSAEVAPQSALRTALAGLIGNVLEWFDFAVYGYFASDIGKQFFPQSSPARSSCWPSPCSRSGSSRGRSAASCSAWSATGSAAARC